MEMNQEELNKVIKDHGLWLLGESGSKKADLSNANLTGADLTGADLEDANLTNADLTNANLRCADLTGTILETSANEETTCDKFKDISNLELLAEMTKRFGQ